MVLNALDFHPQLPRLFVVRVCLRQVQVLSIVDIQLLPASISEVFDLQGLLLLHQMNVEYMILQFGECFIIFDKQGINDIVSHTLRTASISNMLEDVDEYKVCARFEQLAAIVQLDWTELQAKG